MTTGGCDLIHTFEVLKTLYLSVKVNIHYWRFKNVSLTGSGLTSNLPGEKLM